MEVGAGLVLASCLTHRGEALEPGSSARWLAARWSPKLHRSITLQPWGPQRNSRHLGGGLSPQHNPSKARLAPVSPLLQVGSCLVSSAVFPAQRPQEEDAGHCLEVGWFANSPSVCSLGLGCI